jgi:hypothetical protein
MCHVDALNTVLLDLFSRSAATLLGLFLFIATTVSLLRTVVVPRALSSSIANTISGTVTGIHRFIAYRRKTYKGRDAVLAWNGPMIIVSQLIAWLLLYFLAYALWIYGIAGMGFGEALRQSGSSLFTLGFANSNAADPTILEFMAAATGPIVIALMIGFLPTIYSTYVDREVNVALLSVTGGEPSWGPEYLARLTLSNQLVDAADRFRSWINWFGNVRLTHTTYPVLTRIRSASPYRHWLISALCVMDAASLQLSLTKTLPREQASELIIHGTQTFETLYARIFVKEKIQHRIPFLGKYFGSPNLPQSEMEKMPGYRPGTIAVEMATTADSTRGISKRTYELISAGQSKGVQLTREEFDSAAAMLKEAGYPIEVDLDIAWFQFSIWRKRYEFAAYQLCYALDAVPAPWSGPRHKGTGVIAPTSAVELLKTQIEKNPDSTSRDLTPPDSTSRDLTPPDSTSRAVSPDGS